MAEMAPIFDEIYNNYLAQISEVDFGDVAERIGAEAKGSELSIPLWNKTYRVSGQGIFGPNGLQPNHSYSVVLSKYILMAPEQEPQGDQWVTYKDFKDAGPFAGGFLNGAEKPIARDFTSRLAELTEAGEALGGKRIDTELPYDLVMKFDALPKIPVYLLFNDADEEFPAQCSILFEKRTAGYLDMESVAIIGLMLPPLLIGHKNSQF